MTSRLTLILFSLGSCLVAPGAPMAAQEPAPPTRAASPRPVLPRTTPIAPPGYRHTGGDAPALLRLLDRPWRPERGPAPAPVLATVDGEQRGTLVTPIPSRLRVPLEVPAGARLHFALDLQGGSPAPHLIDFEVQLVAGTTRQSLFRQSRATFETGWSAHEVDLSAYGGQAVELEFVAHARGSLEGLERTRALWGEPVVRGTTGAPRPDVLLVVVDALRADALGCYGAAQPTPVLDRIAGRGVVLERAIASSSWTVPSTATLLCGRYPSDLWETGKAAPPRTLALPPGVATLAGVLRAFGWYTAGICDATAIPGQRFGRDFDHFVNVGTVGRRRATEPAALLRRLRDSFAALPEGGAFVYVHLVFPDAPLRPPAPYRPAPLGEPPAGATALQEKAWRGRAVYDGEVRLTDAWIGVILELLADAGHAPEVLAVVGSHGFGFADHGERMGTGNSLHEELVHVPWILAAPGRLAASRCGAVVRGVDLMPTVLELAGVEPDPALPGRSVLPLLSGAEPDARLAYSEYPREPSPTGRAIQDARWKLILPRRETTTFQVYDLQADPREQTPLDPELPETDAIKDRLWDEILRVVRAAATYRESRPAPAGDGAR